MNTLIKQLKLLSAIPTELEETQNACIQKAYSNAPALKKKVNSGQFE